MIIPCPCTSLHPCSATLTPFAFSNSLYLSAVCVVREDRVRKRRNSRGNTHKSSMAFKTQNVNQVVHSTFNGTCTRRSKKNGMAPTPPPPPYRKTRLLYFFFRAAAPGSYNEVDFIHFFHPRRTVTCFLHHKTKECRFR